MDLLRALRRRPFLTQAERDQIEAGLATARRHADAPIGLVIEERAEATPGIRAQHLFSVWALPERDRARAILLYACGATRRFVVVGGDEIRRVAPPAFWGNLQRDLARHFEEQRYCDGLFKAVADIAIMLHAVYAAADPCESTPPPPKPPNR
jgi:uncharacterized membrane protein YgcG